MTVQEYNYDFLPKIERAKEFVRLFESGIDHMDSSTVDKDGGVCPRAYAGVRRVLERRI